MKARITQMDIARVAGVHNTTVSLALRNCSSIPQETRRRIQAIAGEMGYHPDPALQALVAYRKGRRTHARPQTIAYITHWDSRWGWRSVSGHENTYAGAMAKAEMLGCQIEHFWLGEPDMNQSRLSSVLFHRGITGVILASHRPGSGDLLHFSWERFSAVTIGCFPRSPALNRIVEDPAGAIRLAMRKTIAMGYQRIGLIMPSWSDELVDQTWSGGYIMEQRWLPEKQRLPIFRPEFADGRVVPFDAHPPGTTNAESLASWIERHRPDAILTLVSDLGSELRQLRLSVPDEVALVNLAAQENEARWSGVRQNSRRVGELAVETVVNLMQQNICGIPPVPTTTVVAGTWVDGETLPAAGALSSLETFDLAKA